MRIDSDRDTLWMPVLVLLGILAGVLKIIGGVVYVSRAVLVDAATSIANIVSLFIIIHYKRLSREPPDHDHMYGHTRLAYGGDLFTVSIYSFIAGILIVDLVESFFTPYRVDVRASLYSLAGLVVYVLVVALARLYGRLFIIYAKMTYIEIIEGSVATIAAYIGATASYTVDLLGGVLLYSVLVYELYSSTRILLSDISDKIPRDVVETVYREVSRLGLEVRRIRLRQVYEGVYQGDIDVLLPGDMSLREVHMVIDKIERSLLSKNIAVTIHPEPYEKRS